MANAGSYEQNDRQAAGETPRRLLPLWLCILLPALGGWLGWGTRGQFGHEAGAFVPGALMALGLALCSRHWQVRQRALLIGAAGAIGTGFGGAVTYGQTNGMMYNEGWQQTYWYGFLGLGIKSGMWFGLGAAFMGMAAGFKRYRPWEVLGITAAMTVAFYVGYLLLNKPFDPEHQRLPLVYFSDWYGMGKENWKPRQEYWGGLWFGLLWLMIYITFVKKDPFAARVGLWGIIGGAIAMPCAQSIHAGVSHLAAAGRPLPFSWINWWSIFETSCGLIAGLFIAAGWIVSERGRRPLDDDDSGGSPATTWAVGIFALGWLIAFLLFPTWRGPWSDLKPERPELFIPFIAGGSWIAFAFTGQFAQWANLLTVLTVTAAQNITDNWAEKKWIVASWPRPAAWILGAALILVALLLSRQRRGGARLAAAALTAVGGIQIAMSMTKSWLNEISLATLGVLPPRPPSPADCQASLMTAVNEFAFICAFLVIAALAWWGACRVLASGQE